MTEHKPTLNEAALRRTHSRVAEGADVALI
jgi:hypothetical protein